MRRPVLYKGKQVYVGGLPVYETDFSDRLLERLLEKTNPDSFWCVEQTKMEHYR